MDPFAVSHFSDRALLHDLKTLVTQDRRTTAVLLTRIVEVEERQLFRREGYPSMYTYCLHELHFSEGAAYKHINAGRAARQFPAVLMAVAEGRLHLSGVVTLASRLTSGNADDLVAAATHKTRAEIELLLALRFPRPDLAERLQAISRLSSAILPEAELSPGKVDASTIAPGWPVPVDEPLPGTAAPITPSIGQAAPGAFDQALPGSVEAVAPRPRVTPLAPERFGLQVTLDQESYDLLQQARALMSHQNPAGEIAPVLKSALKLLVADLEKRKFAATTRPGPARCGTSARHIPAAVKREVWARDGGQCSFESETGQRCPARKLLEFDHEDPVARGGAATVDNVRLRCRAHNAYEAERAFGAGFMERKRAEAQGVRAARMRASEVRASGSARGINPARPSPTSRPACDAMQHIREGTC